MEVIEMRKLVVVVTVLLVELVTAPSANAGGTWFGTVEESYDPGDEVTAVAYVGAAVTDEPVVVRMSRAPMTPTYEVASSDWLELGRLTLESTGLTGYLETRASITFTLPEDLEPGPYMIEARPESGGHFGDLIGMILLVGVEPDAKSGPRWFEWALDDPLIEDLTDDAVVAGPGFGVPVRDLKAGKFPPGAAAHMLHPENLPEPPPPPRIPPFLIEEGPAEIMVTNPAAVESGPASQTTSGSDIDAPRLDPLLAPVVEEPIPPAGRMFDPFAIGLTLVVFLTLAGGTLWRFTKRRLRVEDAPDRERVLTRT